MPRKYRRSQRRRSKSRKRILLLVIAVLIAVASITVVFLSLDRDEPQKKDVRLRTNFGDIVIRLYDDMPNTISNFKNLVQEGVYDGTIFHRVIDGFMVQGGDPTGTGYGDPSIPTIADEFTDHNRNDRGTVAMANAGPNTGSSQFYINLVHNNDLDDKHPVFGEVIEGMDVVDNIGKMETDQNNRPLQDVVITVAGLLDR